MKKQLAGFLALAAVSAAHAEPATGIIVLDETMSGAATVAGQARVVAASLKVASRSRDSVTVGGQGRIECAEIRTHGGCEVGGKAQLMGAVWESQDRPADPVAPRFADGFEFDGLLELARSGSLATDLGQIKVSGGDQAVNATPGFYSGGMNLSGGTVHLEPGLYLFGGDVSLSSGATLTGTDVTIVLLEGSMTVTGTTQFQIDGPDEGTYAGLSIVMPATNDGSISLTAGSELVVRDTLWAPSARLRVNGRSASSMQGPIVGEAVIVNSLEMAGRGTIRLGVNGPADILLTPQYD